eukprot:143138-Amorphochlora_amoeboformis.AAC.1
MGARQVVANFILPRTGDDSFTALSVENSLNILHGRVGEGEEEGELTRGEIDRLDRCIKVWLLFPSLYCEVRGDKSFERGRDAKRMMKCRERKPARESGRRRG